MHQNVFSTAFAISQQIPVEMSTIEMVIILQMCSILHKKNWFSLSGVCSFASSFDIKIYKYPSIQLNPNVRR